MTPLQWFWGFLKQYRWKLVLGLFLTTCISVLAVVYPKISGQIVDQVILGKAYGMLPQLLFLLIAATALRSILRFFYQLVFETVSQGVLFQMRDQVYRKFMMEDFAFYHRNRTGDLMSRQIGDMDAIRHFVAFVIYMVYENLLLFIFALVMIFIINAKLALAMLITLPLTALTTYFQSKAVKPAFSHIRECYSSLNTYVQENISGNRMVRAFAGEAYELDRFQEENSQYMESELSAAAIWVKYVPVFELLSNLLMIILMLYGGFLTIQGDMTVGGLVAVNGYLWMLTNPLRFCGWWTNDVQRFMASLEKIYKVFTQEPEIKNTAALPVEQAAAAMIQGNVAFEHVGYKAPDGAQLLNDICFSVKKGQTIGVIGATGAGKSTVMNLLCRFYDVTSGAVLIDGVNVKDYDLKVLRDHIGIAMQDVFLFSDTIEGNIAYGRPDCSFEDVKAAAIMADANHFIKSMPEGYETIVGERGVGLSGGQKQRISLARALLKKPSILILDDTTSAVDMETESYIQQQLKKLKNSCTIFVIAHRISSIIDSDQILVMDSGRISERGTHAELLKKNGYYAEVFRNQYGDFDRFVRQGESDGTEPV